MCFSALVEERAFMPTLQHKVLRASALVKRKQHLTFVIMHKGDHPPMRTRPFICLYAVLLLGASLYAQNTGTAQPAPTAPQATPQTHGPARIVTRTRLVSIFSGMENQLF